jgi:predicted PurR-regulated permease PerM
MDEDASDRRSFAGRVLIAVGVGAALLVLLYLLQQLAEGLLIVFAGLLLAVALDALAYWVSKRSGLPRSASLALIGVLVPALLFVIAWFAGPRIADQAGRLQQHIPTALAQLKSSLQQVVWLRSLTQDLPSLESLLSSGSGLVGRITGIFSSAVGVILGCLVILFIGIFVAFEPDSYIDSALRLVPAAKRDRVREVMASLGEALRWWLVGRIASMFVVGVLTVVGLFILGIPLAFILGLLAALLAFVPLIGPITSVFPAALIGLLESPLTALYVVLLYIVVQMLEGHLITPLIQKRAVSLPPALLIVSQLLMAVMFGWIGVLLSTPLLVVVIVLVQMLYVEDIIGDSVMVLGHHGKSGA